MVIGVQKRGRNKSRLRPQNLVERHDGMAFPILQTAVEFFILLKKSEIMLIEVSLPHELLWDKKGLVNTCSHTQCWL